MPNLSERLEADIVAIDAKIRANHQASESPPPSPELLLKIKAHIAAADGYELDARPNRIWLESPQRSPPRRRPSLWSRLVQHLCPHPTTTSARVPGAIPPVYQCHCWSCDRRWAEAGE